MKKHAKTVTFTGDNMSMNPYYSNVESDKEGKNRVSHPKWLWILAAIALVVFLVSELYGTSPDRALLHEALKARKHEKAINLIRNLSVDLNEPNDDGELPLVLAADDESADAFDVVRELLNRGALAGEANGNGYTALHWAAFHGNMAVADLLIRNGADVNAGTEKKFETPIYKALSNGNLRVAEFLESFGASIPEKVRKRVTADGLVKRKIDELHDLPKPDNVTDAEWSDRIVQMAFELTGHPFARFKIPADAMEAFSKIMNQPRPEGVTDEQWIQMRRAEAMRQLRSGELPAPTNFPE